MKKKISFISIIGIFALLICSIFIKPDKNTEQNNVVKYQAATNSTLVDQITNAKDDYVTKTVIELSEDINLDNVIAKTGITIKSGQNIVFQSKKQDLVIGTENLGYKLNISVPFILEKSSTVTFENDVILSNGGSISAKEVISESNDFNAVINFNDSLTLEDGSSINSKYFKSFNVFAGLNAYEHGEQDILINSDDNSPIDFNTSYTTAILIGDENFPQVTGKFEGEFAVISNNKNNIYTVDNVGNGYINNDFNLISQDINSPLTGDNILVCDVTLKGNQHATGSLISFRDHTINSTNASFYTYRDTFNINGLVDIQKKFTTSNKLIIDGGAKYQKTTQESTGVYFLDGNNSLDRNLYDNTIVKESNNYPALINIKRNGTVNMFNGAILQNNQLNSRGKSDTSNFGAGVSLYTEELSEKVYFNMYGGKIQFNSAYNIANDIGGAGIGSTTANYSNDSNVKNNNIHIYNGEINHNSIDNKAQFSGGGGTHSGDGAGISVNRSSNLIIDNGSISYNHGAEAYDSDGAGIMVRAGAIVDIQNGDISYNYANGYGGGLCLWQSKVTILNGNFYGNRATFGGGIALSTDATLSIGDATKTVNIYNNIAEKYNSTKDSGYGGGIAVGNDTTVQNDGNLKLTVNNANIYDNKATFGGAIASFTSPLDSEKNVIVLNGGNIYNNKAETNKQGNGIFIKQRSGQGTYGHLLEFAGNIRVDTSNNIVFSDLKKHKKSWISNEYILQIPIKVTDELTANGIVGLFDVASGDIKDFKFVEFTNNKTQMDKFLLDSDKYYLTNANNHLIVKEIGTQNNVAQVNGVQYRTLKEALANANNGDTIEILRNLSLTQDDILTITGKKSLTIKSAGSDIYSLALSKDFEVPDGTINPGIIVVDKGSSLTLDNIIIDGNSAISNGFSFVHNLGTFTLGENAKLVNNLSTSGGGAISAVSGDSGSINNIRGQILGNKGPSGAIDIQARSIVNIYSTAVISGNYSSTFKMNVGINLQNDAVLNIYGNPLIEDVIYHQGGNITIFKEEPNKFLTNDLNLFVTKNIYKANQKIINIDDSSLDTNHTIDEYAKHMILVNKEHNGDSLVGFRDDLNGKSYITLDRVIMVKLVFNRLYNQTYDSYENTIFDISKIDTIKELEQVRTALGLTEKLDLHGEDLVIYIHSREQIDLVKLFNFIAKPGYKLESYIDLASKSIINSTSSIEYSTDDSDKSYAAIWREITYTFEFYDSETSVANNSFKYKYETGFVDATESNKQKLPLNEFVKIGYYFANWKLEDEYFYDGHTINKDFVLKYGSSENNVIRLYTVFKSIFDETSGDGINKPFVLANEEHIKYLAYTVNGYGNNGVINNPLTFELPNGSISTYYNEKGAYTPFDYNGYKFELKNNINNVSNLIGYLPNEIDISNIINNNMDESKPFSGEFDGNNFTIKLDLSRDYTTSGIALFAYTKEAYIHDLTVEGTVTGKSFVAGIISLAIGGKYENLTNKANVEGSGFNIGGVFSTVYTPVGKMYNSYIRTVINNGNVRYNVGTSQVTDLTKTLEKAPKGWNEGKYLDSKVGSRIGGIIGQSLNVNLTKAYNTGDITGRFAVGGIIGALAATKEDDSSLSNVDEAFNNGTIKATSGVLFAYTYVSDRLANSKQTMDIVSAYVGGIIGRMYGSGVISNSANDGAVSATYVGKKIASSNIDNWTGEYEYVENIKNVTNGEYVGARGAGGILGISSFSKESGIVHGGNKEIKYVYNTGHISAFSGVGGIAGFLAYSTINYAISGGFLTATGFSFNDQGEKVIGGNVYKAVSGNVRRNYIGGLVGFAINTTLYNNSIFNSDIQTEGVTDPVIKAIGDSEMSLIGFEENTNTSLKLSSKELFVGENNTKPTGLKSTFLDQGWKYLNYLDNYFYYPQLEAFAKSDLKINNSTLGEYSKNSVQMFYSDNGTEEKPLEPTKKIMFSYELNGGTLVTGTSSGVEELPDGNYKYADVIYTLEKSSNILTSSIEFNTKSIKPLGTSQLNRDGYTFGGWYRDSQFSEKYDFDNISAVDITLYAKWDIIEYNINYVGINSYADGKVSLVGDYRKSFTITEKGTRIDLPTKDNFNSGNNSYEFVGFKYVLSDKFYDVDSFIINDNNKIELYYQNSKVNLPESHIIELGDLEFKLEARPIEFSISYELDGSTNHQSNPNKYTIRDQFDFKDPVKKGYTFDGWYTSSDFIENTKIDGITRGTIGNKTIYAKFTKNNYALSLDKKTGNFIGVNLEFEFEGNKYKLEEQRNGLYTVLVPYGTNLSDFVKVLPKPIGNEGYTFTAWSKNTENNIPVDDLMPDVRYSIFAYYDVTKYQITINKNVNATYNINQEFIDKYKHYNCIKGPNGEKVIITVPYGSDISDFLADLKQHTEFEQSYHFNGWDPDGFNYYNVKGNKTNLEINLLVDKEIISWEIYDKDNTYITSINNKMPGFESTFSMDNLKQYLENNTKVDFNKDGYIFKGFSFANNGKLLGKDEYIIREHKVVFIKYEAKEYDIRFNVNGGSDIVGKFSVKYEQKFEHLPNCYKVGYNFIGWEYERKLIDSNTIFKPTNSNISEVLLVARYEIINFNIYYENLKEATKPTLVNFNVENTVVQLPTLKNVLGYNFVGFKFKGTEKIITEFNSIDNPHDVYLEAVWEAVTFEITFSSGDGGYFEWNQTDEDNGDFYLDDKKVESRRANKFVFLATYKGQIYYPQAPKKDGHTFRNYKGDLSTNKPEAQTVIAEYDALKFEVLFDTVGGTEIKKQDVAYNGKIHLDSNPVKVGYTFKYWEYNGKVFNIDTDTVTTNMVLKAIYELNKYKLEINIDYNGSLDISSIKADIKKQLGNSVEFNGNKLIVEIPYGHNLESLNNLENTNQSVYIVGYFKDNSPYTFTTMPVVENGNLVITLRLTDEISYTVVGQYKVLNEIKTINLHFVKQLDGTYKLVNIPLNIFGYEFNGWYKEEDFIESTKIDFDKNYAESEVIEFVKGAIYAKLSPISYKISLIIQNQTITLSYTYGMTKAIIKDLLMEEVNKKPIIGSKFEKFVYTASNIDFIASEANNDDIISGDIALSAKYIEVVYKIRWHYNNNFEDVNYVYNQKIELVNFEKKYYSVEWYLGNDKVNYFKKFDITSMSTMPNLDNIDGKENFVTTEGDSLILNIYAKETPIEYTIKFNLDGGNSSSDFVKFNVKSESISLIKPSKKYEEFIGFLYSETKIEMKDSYTFDELIRYFSNPDRETSISFKASYQAIKYTIVSGSDRKEFTYKDVVVSIRGFTKPLKEGYEFKGFQLVKGGNIYNEYIDVNELLKEVDKLVGDNKEINLILKYVENEYEILVVDEYGATIDPISYKFKYSETNLTLKDLFERNNYSFTKPGHFFNGQLITKTFEQINLDITLNAILKYASSTNAIALKPVFEAYTYDIILTNGSENEIIKVTFGHTTQLLLNDKFNKKGYTFLYWQDAKGKTYTAGSQVIDLITPTAHNQNIELTAKYKANTYTIRFKGSGATSGQMNDQTFTYGKNSKLNLNQFEKIGYKFVGWSYEGKIYQDEAEIINLVSENNVNLTFTAKWQAIKYYIEFYDDKQSTKKLEFTYDLAANLPIDVAIKEGYDFLGWSREENSSKVDFAPGEQILNLTATDLDTIKLYAIWQKKVLTITIHIEDTINHRQVEYGSVIKTLPAPEKVGHKFVGWYLQGDVKFDLNTPILEDVHIYAKHERMTYNITYLGVDDSFVPINKTYTYGDSFRFEEPSLVGYQFVGWFENNEQDKEIKGINPNDFGDKTIVAKWIVNKYLITFYLNNILNENAAAIEKYLSDILSEKKFELRPVESNKDEFTTNLTIEFVVKYGTDLSFLNNVLAKYNLLTRVDLKDKNIKTIYQLSDYSEKSSQGIFEFGFVEKPLIVSAEYKEISSTLTYIYKYKGHSYKQYLEIIKNENGKYIVDSLPEYIVDGYLVGDWLIESSNEKFEFNKEFANKLTVYTEYSPIVYSIIFDKNSDFASGEMSKQTFKYDLENTLQNVNFINKGHTFLGWSRNKHSKTPDFKDNESVLNLSKTNNDIINLYAVWEKNNYKVTFNTNGGNAVDSIVVFYDEVLLNKIDSKLFIKNGYKFIRFEVEGKVVDSNYKMPDNNITVDVIFDPISYIIKFDSSLDDSQVMENLVVKFNDSVKLTKNKFARKGYKFVGWSYDKDDIRRNYKDEDVIHNLTNEDGKVIILYAVWEANLYNGSITISGLNNYTFIKNHVTNYLSHRILTDVNVSIQDNSLVVTFKAPYNSDLKFLNNLLNGYRVIKQDNKEYNFENFDHVFDRMPDDGLTVNGVYKVKKYTLTFTYTYKNEKFTNEYIVDESKLFDLNTIKVEEFKGYKFSGFFENEDCLGNKLEGEISINDNKQIFGKYDPIKYTIEYEFDGRLINSQEFVYDVLEQLNSCNETKTGYTFKGWSYNGNIYSDAESIMNLTTKEETIRFIAKLEQNEYNIYFDTDGGNYIESVKVLYGNSVELKDATKEGYKFIGWYLGEEKISEITNYNYDRNITLKAKYAINEYVIEFTDGQNVVRQNVTHNTLVTLKPNEFIKLGYKFIGWSSKEGSNEITYIDKDIIAFKESMKLYAVFEIINYKITFINDFGVNKVFSYNIESEDIIISKPSKSGYKFLGYNDGKETILDYVIRKGTTGDIVLTAEFEIINYTIKYVNVDGSEINENYLSKTYNIENIVTFRNYDKVGYKFIGWKKQGTDEKLLSTNGLTENLVLELITEKLQYTVKFDTFGGSRVNDIIVDYKDIINDIDNIISTKYGYNFVGWYLDHNFEDKYQNNEITENITLYAKFEAKIIEVSFEGIEDKIAITFGNKYGILPTISKDGHTFVGWFDGDTRILDSTILLKDSNHKLTPKFVVNNYTVYFETNSQTRIPSQNVVFGNKVNRPELLTKTGYEFAGWFKEKTFETEWNFEEDLVNEVTTLYAKWNLVTYNIIYSYEGIDAVSNTNETTYTVERLVEFKPLHLDGYRFVGFKYKDKFITSTASLAENIKVVCVFESITYNIHFEGFNNENMPSIKVNYNDYIKGIITPSKVGYRFIKWTYNGQEVKNNDLFNFTCDITLKANYEVITYGIKYENVDGIDNINPNTYNVSQTVVFKNLTKVGYKFIGFKHNEEFISSTDGLTGNITLAAVFEKLSYKVTFVTNTLDKIADKNIFYDEIITHVNDLSKKGYTFKGWYSDSEFNNLWNLSTDRVTKDLVLYAKFEANNYNVVFNYKDKTVTQEMIYDKSYNLLLNKEERNGYKFIGWSTQKDSTVVSYKDNEVVYNLAESGEFNLYAVYELINYEITYEGANKLNNRTNYNVETPTFKLENPTKKGYKFVGWYNGDKLVTEITKGTTGNIKLVARFEANKYNVVFVDGDKTYTQEITYDKLTNLTPTEYTKLGYQFIGWSVENDNKVDYLDREAILNLVAEGEIKLYACYKVDTYYITYVDGYNKENSSTYTVEKEVVFKDAYMNGYRFIGWYLDDQKLVSTGGLTGNIRLVAKYEIIEYHITYIDELNATNNNKDTYTIESNISLENLEKEGYNFLGWYLNDKSITEITSGKTGDITLVAKWERIKLTVKFDTNSLSKIEDLNVLYGNVISYIKSPEKLGYKFIGWYLSDDLSEKLINLNEYVVTKDITLKAKYEIVTYTITYLDDNGEILDIENSKFNINNNIELEAYNKSGYKFIGWYLNDQKILNTNGIYENITVKVKYEIITYNIKYVGYENLGFESTFTVENNIELLPVSKLGHKFIGWYFEGKLITNTEGYTKDLALEARFEVNKYKITFKDGNNVVKEIYVDHGSSMTNEVLPSDENHIFMGWKLNGELFDITTPITKDIILVAKWGFLTLEHKVQGTDNLVITIKSNKGFAEGTKVNFEVIDNEIDLTNATTALEEIGRLQVLYDISLCDSEGNEIAVDENVSITFKSPEKKYYEIYRVIYITDDYSNYEELSYIEENGNITFTTNHFSLYGIVVYDGPKNFSWLWILIVTLITLGFSITVIVLVKNRKYTIKYITNSDDKLESSHYKPDEIVDLPSPYKPGYEFVGWYYDNNYFKPALFSIMPKSSLTLFAKWKPIEIIDNDYIPVPEDDESVDMPDLEQNEEFYIPVPEDDELVEVRVEEVSFEIEEQKNDVEEATSHFNDYTIDMEQLIKDTDDSSK